MAAPPTTMLWRAWRERADESAFAELVRDQVRYAADLARRIGASPGEADDLVQEALVKLAREQSDVPLQVGVRAWLCRRVILGFKMHVRGATRRRKYEGGARGPRAPDEPARRAELRDSVYAALDTLHETERRAVVLRHLHDCDYREMAHILGISRNACRLRVFKGLRRMRARLGSDAATMIALVGVPPLGQALVPTALAAAQAAPALAVGSASVVSAKVVTGVAAGVVATAAATVVLMRAPDPDPPAPAPPPVVEARVPPPVARPPEPDPPPAPPRRSAALTLLDDHFARVRDGTGVLDRFEDVTALLPKGEGATVRLTDTSTPVNLAGLARIATRIEFGPGTFTVRGYGHLATMSLEIVGAGMRRTILRQARADLRVREAVGGLTVRDLTCEGGVFLDVRGRAAAVFERVRFRGWQDTAGYGAPVGLSGTALLAFRDCHFIGGYKRKRNGVALSVRGQALFLFERCRFRDLEGAISNWTRPPPPLRCFGRFRDCTFEATRLVRGEERPRGAYPIALDGGDVLYGLASQSEGYRRKQFRFARATIEAPARLAPEPARTTLKELRAVLKGFRPLHEERVIAVVCATWHEAPEPRYFVYLRGVRKQPGVVVVRRRGKHVEIVDASDYKLDARLSLTPGPGTLLEALDAKRPELDHDVSCGGVFFTRYSDGSPVAMIVDRHMRRRDFRR